MAFPPYGFGAHVANVCHIGEGLELLDAIFKGRSFHVICIASKGWVFPFGIWGVFIDFSSSSEFKQVNVIDLFGG